MFLIANQVKISQAVKVQEMLGLSNPEFAKDLEVTNWTTCYWRRKIKNGEDGYVLGKFVKDSLITHMIELNSR